MTRLLRAPGGHRRGVEEQHDWPVGEQSAELARGAGLVGKFEVSHGVTGFHGRHATPVASGADLPIWEDDSVHANLAAATTSREHFRLLAAEHRVVPVTRKVLADAETPLSAYRKLADNRPGTFLLESAENGRSWSRWSFIGAGAPSALTVRDGQAVWLGTVPHDAPTGGDPLQALQPDLGAAGHGGAAGAYRRCPAAWWAFSPTTWCGAWSGCPSSRSTT